MSKAEAAARCSDVRLLLAVDDSGSMQADDRGVRCAAALAMVRLLRDLGGGRAGVLRWTHRIEAELAPVDVRRGAAVIRQALAPRPVGGGNDVVNLLRRAAGLLSGSGPDEPAALVLLTDGQEFSYRPDATDHLAAAAAAVADLGPVAVHVVLIDHEGRCTAEEEAAWRSLALASFRRATLADPDQFCRDLGAAVFATFGIRLAAAPTSRRFPW
jgi:Mg-chelatase subunit ChlD